MSTFEDRIKLSRPRLPDAAPEQPDSSAEVAAPAFTNRYEVKYLVAPERLPEILEVLTAFDVSNPRILSYLETVFLHHLEDISAKTMDSLRVQLLEGIEAGEGISQLAPRIAAMPAFSADRAERIARTETIGAFNLGTQEGFNKAETPRKSWLSTRDGERVRRSHQDIDTQTSATPIPARERFTLVDEKRGTAELMFPGDPSAPAWAVVNCRCAMVPEDEELFFLWVKHCRAELSKSPTYKWDRTGVEV